MSEQKEEKKVSRRLFVTVTAPVAVVAAVGGFFGGWFSRPPKEVVEVPVEKEVVREVIKEVPVEVEKAVERAVEKPIPRIAGLTVSERAINGVKKLVEAGKIQAGARVKGLVYAGTAGGYTQWVDKWKELTGTTLEIETVPIEESYDKLMLEATAKTGEWDFFATDYAYRGDFWESGLVHDLTDWVRYYDPIPFGEPDGWIYPLDKQGAEYMPGRFVSIPFDGDVHTMFIRKDLLENPREQEAFEKEYGYPLKVPETWDEYADQVHFFHRPPDLYGNLELKALWWQINQWLTRYSSMRFPVMPMFDEDFNPLIDGPEGIRATEMHWDMYKHTSPDILAWGWAEKYAAWAAGKGYIDFTYPSMGKFMELPEFSEVVGKNVGHMVPGTWVTTPAGIRILNRTTTHDGTQVLYINKYGKNPELAYLFCQWIGSPEQIIPTSIHPASFTDITRYTQFTSPIQAEAWGKGDIGLQKLKALKESHRFMVPGFNFAGGWEYRTILDRNLQEVFSERVTPEECMEKTAKMWDEVTDRLGREKLKEAWRWVLTTFPAGYIV